MPIFVDDHLISYSKGISQRAKELQCQGMLQFVWCREGNIFIRERAETKAVKDANLDQLLVEPQLQEVEEGPENECPNRLHKRRIEERSLETGMETLKKEMAEMVAM